MQTSSYVLDKNHFAKKLRYLSHNILKANQLGISKQYSKQKLQEVLSKSTSLDILHPLPSHYQIEQKIRMPQDNYAQKRNVFI
jgi:hypothetical protein